MISAPFSLLQLPKLSSNKKNKVQVDIHGSNAFVGVSSSSISALGLKPPQEFDAFSVSPGTIINALCVYDDKKIFYGTSERKKHFLKVTNGPSTPVQGSISCIYSTETTILVVYNNLTIESFTHELQSKWVAKEFGGKKEVAVFSSLVNDSQFFLVTLNNQTFNLLLFSFSASECSLLQRTELPFSAANDLWSYAEGALFHSSKGKITLFDVVSGIQLAHIDVDASDILAVTNESCLIVQDKSLVLVDSKYQAKLAEYPLEQPVKLLAFAPDASCGLVETESDIMGFSLTVPQGSLFDSIGHGIASSQPFKYGYTDIFNFSAPVRELKKNAIQRIEAAQKETQEILKELKQEKPSSSSFSRIISYLKGNEWSEAQPQLEFVTYEETDRHVDKDFIEEIALFSFADPQNLPESVGIYLLTHPLFPTNNSKFANLFNMLESNSPLLYRQAVVTLKGARAKDIIEALSDQSEEIFSDAVARLDCEFSYEQIVAGIQQAFAKSRSVQAAGLGKLATRLSQHPQGWTLVSPLIDTVGLHSWDLSLIKTLDSRLSRQIDHVKGLQSVNLTISELLRSVDIDVAATGTSLSRSEIKRKSRKGQTHQRKLEQQFAETPRYSIETLVFTEHQ